MFDLYRAEDLINQQEILITFMENKNLKGELFEYPGYFSSKAHEFFGDSVIHEERDGCAVAGSFLKLKDGKTILLAKGQIFLKDSNNGITLFEERK